jgi:hypothetical protein
MLALIVACGAQATMVLWLSKSVVVEQEWSGA